MLSHDDLIHVLLESAALLLALQIMFTAGLARRSVPVAFRSLRLYYWHSFGLYCAMMGFIHVILSVTAFDTDIQWTGPVTWLFNQLGFVVLLGLVWHKPQKINNLVGILLGAGVGLSVGICLIRTRYIFEGEAIGRPYELVPLLAAAPLVYRLWRRPRAQFQNWLLSAALVFVAQEAIMLFSNTLHDTPFLVAHCLQVVTMILATRALREFKPGSDN